MSSLTASDGRGEQFGAPSRVRDWGGLHEAFVAGIAHPESEAELQALVRHAGLHGLKVSLRGCGHSSGGQSFAKGALMVDLRSLDRVLHFDPDGRTIRLQGGATWAAVTEACEPHRLGPTTKQEFESFTIGGSLAANAHGKSIDHGPLIGCVRSLRLLTARGEIIQASREQHGDVFRAAIGGYGLLGAIVDATLDLVEDRPVRNSERTMLALEPLLERYLERVGDRERTPLCYGFLDRDFRRGFYVAYTYVDDSLGRSLDELKRHEPAPALFNAFVALQRRSPLVRRHALRVLWAATRKPELTLRSRRLLLWDEPPVALHNSILQKYIVPVEGFTAFARRAGEILARHGRSLPLLSPHFRFVPGGDEAVLPLAERDSVCLILSHLTSSGDPLWRQTFERATYELLEACGAHGGHHYLTFDSSATRDQLVRAYPRWEEFVAIKRRIDPDGLFTSRFYEQYECEP